MIEAFLLSSLDVQSAQEWAIFHSKCKNEQFSVLRFKKETFYRLALQYFSCSILGT